ncbi:MAG: LamG domain-containing protein [Candidatus Kryptoniota bacterium]
MKNAFILILTLITFTTISCNKSDPVVGSSSSVDSSSSVAGNALWLDGQTGYLEVPNSSSLSSPDTAITLEAWVFPAYQYYNTVISKGSYNYLLELVGNFPGIILYGATLEATAYSSIYSGRLMMSQYIPAVQWTHVAVTYSQSTGVKVYYDGELVYLGPGTGQIQSGTLPLRIGARVDSNYTEYFNGVIDEVRIWNVVRSQSDIAENMRKELTGTEGGLVAYYKFDEALGSTIIHDATSNHNDGKLYGNSMLVSSTAF